MRRLEHGFDRNLRAFEEIGFAPEKLLVAFTLANFQRASKSFQSEFADKAGAARRRRFAWNQSATVASLERVARQPLRRRAVSLDEQRR